AAVSNRLPPVQSAENPRDNPPPAGHSYIIYRATDDGASNAMIRGMPRDGVTPNCVYIRSSAQYKWTSVLHETGHALGLAHEQQRPDRDLYITYDVCSALQNPRNFMIDEDALLLTPYAYESVMHYGTENGDCHPRRINGGTIVSPEPPDLSIHDVNVFFRMYERSLGHNNAADQLGAAIAVGDFDGDGYMDLAVGAPGNNPDGAVFLWKGVAGAPTGRPGRLVAWTVLKPSDAGVSVGQFGFALAAGDFDGDGRTDLAVGAPGTGSEDGAVFVYLQRPATLYTPRQKLVYGFQIRQSSIGGGFGDAGDAFGHALAARDFD